MPYKRKKKSAEYEAWRRFKNSKTYKKMLQQACAIKRNPSFQKEYALIKKAYPLYTQKPYIRTKDVYDKWMEFCNKWKIDDGWLICKNKVVMKHIFSIREKHYANGEAKPVVSPLCPHTEQECKDYGPIITLNTAHCLGKPSITQGRKRRTEFYREIKSEYKKRKKKEKSEPLMNDLAKKHDLSYSRIYQIIYNKNLLK